MTDPCGRTAGVETTVSNLSRGECGMPYDHSYRLPDDEVETAEMTAQRAFSDLRDFLESIVSREGATAIIVFAASMERRAFRAAGFSPDGCAFVDLQREIRRRLKMEQFLSLDRLACMIGFSTDGATISSAHFQSQSRRAAATSSAPTVDWGRRPDFPGCTRVPGAPALSWGAYQKPGGDRRREW